MVANAGLAGRGLDVAQVNAAGLAAATPVRLDPPVRAAATQRLKAEVLRADAQLGSAPAPQRSSVAGAPPAKAPGVSASVEPVRVGARASLAASRGPAGQVDVAAQAQVGLEGRWRASAGGRRAGVETGGEAFAGVRLRANASTTPLGSGAGGDAFAGVRYQQDARLRIGRSSVQGSVDGRAGVGATARVDAGLRRVDGRDKLRLSGKAGLALGVGGGASGGVDIDVTPLVRPVRGVARVLGRVLSWPRKLIGAPMAWLARAGR